MIVFAMLFYRDCGGKDGICVQNIFLVCTGRQNNHYTQRHPFLRSKPKEPPKFLSSSDIRGDKFIFVNNVLAQQLALSTLRLKTYKHILNFRVMAVRDEVSKHLSKNISTSRPGYTYLMILSVFGSSVLGKVLILTLAWSV